MIKENHNICHEQINGYWIDIGRPSDYKYVQDFYKIKNKQLKNLVIIPARGGSKRLPGKNIKLAHGKPLIQYTIDCARELFEDKDIIVSTDSKQIKDAVEQLGLYVLFH